MAARVLRYTRIVRNPDTFEPVALVAGSEVPGWAEGMVHEDDLRDAETAPEPVEPEPTDPPEGEGDDERDGETPDRSWTNPQIKKWAAEHQVDLGEATTKDDMLAVIANS